VGLAACICTHNPRMEVLRWTIASLARQTVPPGTFEVLIVDNASHPPLGEEVLSPLRTRGIPARIRREERPGVAQARLHAIRETKAGWILFVDDDNELAETFVEEGLRFLGSRADVGCFGGKLLLPPALRPPSWARPFLGYLAIKDLGEEVIAGIADHWGEWEPPTAGAFVRRDIAEAFRERVEADGTLLRLGRRGRNGVASCEDSLMMRQALWLGALNAYVPRLRLQHHIDERRLRFGYLLRLMAGYGRSLVLLEKVERAHGGEDLVIPPFYRRPWRFVRLLLSELNHARRRTSLAFGMGMVAYHWNARREYLSRKTSHAL